MNVTGKPERITERQLVNGWGCTPRVRVRQATAGDLDSVAELVPLAGVRLEEELLQAVTDDTAGAALRAGLRAGRDGFTGHLAEQFFAHQNHDQLTPYLHTYLHAALVLVAEHRDQGIVGTLVAYPPPHVALEHVEQSVHCIPDPHERSKLLLMGCIGLTKVKAVAVAESARGQHIGGSLLKRCKQVYQHCGYLVIYGQMPPTPGLDAFYRHRGFEILDEGAGLDLWVIFGVPSHVYPDPGERIFFRHQRP